MRAPSLVASWSSSIQNKTKTLLSLGLQPKDSGDGQKRPPLLAVLQLVS